ncbi:MAG: hypothetical protein N4A71_20145 [Carboxylicivirga sp.]|jgi:hypothetical protein|nr:hypothetical protein [Carboxylicivirga sp.]
MKKTFKRIAPAIGMIGIIVSIIALVVQTRQTNLLAKKEFEHALIIQAMEIEDNKERLNYLRFNIKMKWIDEESLSMSIDSISYQLGYNDGKKVGIQSGLATRSINTAIARFYSTYKRLPKNLKELNNTMRVSKALNHFNWDIYYRILSNSDFKLIYPGADGFMHTRDDKVFSSKDIIQ